jgi:hypothetical protein
MKKSIIVPIITGVLALFLGFFGGYLYQKGKAQSGRLSMNQAGMVRGASTTASVASRNNLMKGTAPVSGKIISLDSTSITVQTQDGSNKIILISDTTKINKTTEGTKDDLKEGTEVMVAGNTTNGAVSAESITIGTNFMRAQVSPTPTTAK